MVLQHLYAVAIITSDAIQKTFCLFFLTQKVVEWHKAETTCRSILVLHCSTLPRYTIKLSRLFLRFSWTFSSCLQLLIKTRHSFQTIRQTKKSVTTLVNKNLLSHWKVIAPGPWPVCYKFPTYPSLNDVNTNFLLGAKCWLRGGVGGQFPRILHWRFFVVIKGSVLPSYKESVLQTLFYTESSKDLPVRNKRVLQKHPCNEITPQNRLC